MERVLDKAGNIVLTDEHPSEICCWTGMHLEHDPMIRIGQHTVAVGAAPSLQRALDEPAQHPAIQLDEAARIMRAERTCSICSEPIDGTVLQIGRADEDEGVSDGQYGMGLLASMKMQVPVLQLHPDCISTFTAALDEVWNHADVVLGDAI